MSGVPQPAAQQQLEAAEAIAIAQLSPALQDPKARVVRGVVTITWPYSIVRKNIAFLLAEADFRLRRAKGQVRVEFAGSTAKAIADAALGSGDEISLSLDGVELVADDSKTRVPGTSLEWQLRFTERVLLQAKISDSEEVKVIDVDHPAQPESEPEELPVSILESFQDVEETPGPIATPAKTPLSKRPADHGLGADEFASPAFLKRARVSYGSLFDGGLDIFDEADDGAKARAKKKPKTGRYSSVWTYASRTPSPEPEAPEEEDTSMVVEEQPTVATPSRPTMVDGACQTVEQETSPPRDVQVAAEARQDPSYWQTPSKSTMIDSGVQSDLPLSPNIGLTPLGFGPPPPMPIFTSAHEQYPPAFQQPPIDPVFGHDMEPHYGAEGPFHEHPSAYPEAGLDHSPMHGHYPTTFLDEPHFGPDGVVTSQPLSEPIPAYQDHPQQHDLEAQPHHTVMVDGVAEPQQIPWGLTSAHYSRSPAKPAESGEVHEGRASSPQDADGETWEEDREREARDDPEDEEALRVEEDQMSEDQDGPEENFASRTYAERRHERGEEAASIEKESSPVGSGSGSGSESSGESDEEAEHEADDTGGDYDITHFRNLSNNQDDDAGTDLESDYGQEEEEEILDPEDDEEAEESEDYDEEGYDEGDYDEDEDQENQPPPAAPRGGPPVVIDLLSDSEDEDEAPPPPPPPAAAPRRQIPQYDGSADEMEDEDMDDQESQGESVRNEDSQQGSSPQPSDAESEEDQASQVGTPTPKPRQAAVSSAPDLTTGSIGDDFETMSPVKLPHMAGVPHSSSRPTSRGESDDLEAELERELEEEIAADDAGSDRQTPAPSEGMAGVEETGIVPSSPFNEDVRHAPPKQAASSPFNEGPAGDTALKQAVSSPVRTDIEDSEVLGEETLAVESPVAEESSPVRVVSAAEEEAGVRSMAEESSPVRSVAKEPAVKSMAEESSPVRPVPAVEEELAVESPVAESSPVRPVAATKKKPAVKSMAEESSPVRPVPAIGEESSPVRPVTATKKEAAVKFPMAEESSPVRPVPVVEEESSPVRPVSAAKEGPAVESLVAEVSSPVRAVGAVEESPEPETEAADVQVAPEEEDDVEPEELVTDEAEGQSLADQSEALVTESLQARIDDAAETEVAQAEDETVQPEVPAEDVTRQTPELEASNVEAPGQTEEVQQVDPDDKVAAKEQSPEHTEVTVAEAVEETVSVDATAHTSPKEATPDHVEIKETEVTKMEVEETQPQSDDEDMEVSLIPDETIVQDVEEATVEVHMDSDDEGSVEPADVDMGDPDDMSVDDEISSNATDSDMELDDVTQDQLIQSQLYEESMMYEEDQTVTTSITTTQVVEERPVSQGGDAADDARLETEVIETSRVTVETTITEPLKTTDAQQAQVEDAMDVDELEDAKSTQMASPTPTPQSFEEKTAETETSQADEQLTPRATQTVKSFSQSFVETQATEVTVPDDGEPQAEQLAEPLDERRPAESPAAAPVQPHEPLLDDEEEVEREKEASTHHEADADAPSPINEESSQIRDSSAQPSEAQSSLIAEDTSEEVVSAAKPTPKRGRGQHHRTNSKDQDPSVKLARASIASRRSTRLSDRTTPDIHSSAAAAPARGTAAAATTTSRGRSASLALKSDSPDADAEDTEVQPARAAVKSPSRAPKTAKESVTKGGKETVPKEAQTKESKAKEKATSKEAAASSTSQPTEQSSAALKAQLAKSLRADVPDCISLKVLRSHPGRTVDVLAVATTNPPEAKRAKGGPRGIMLAFNVTDHSIAPAQTVAVQIFRPHKAALPVIHQGDAVLLRNFSVMVLTRSGFGLRANDGSSWAVFETRRHGHGGEGQGGGDGSSADADAGDDLPQIRGPPVELSEGETGYAALLRRWYAGLDAKSLARLDKANEAAPAVGNVGKEGK
ncbi:uncharacterized protein BDZ83DRAFT_633570 [Colletotrichum acutatum]|uniref:Telomeric single stranded DNA binding POT1/Cdc13 domain-containing protein n=1 Tax=Glomerella acutata TaxID=27357 RepID=A0AAD8UG59_GLOAC|nr:uncharacterized protein BDZ83DRAFT_633570 [Colletotrichum acutatum]KAK1717491.1 hypothetical protein BDZ83DRAFT_633570 [Colletotrichum acutatum]